MSTRGLVSKYNTTKICGQHRCGNCGKDLPTAAGLNRHIANIPGCRKQREQEALRRESARSPHPCVTSNNTTGPQYDSPALNFPPEELPAFIPPERKHPTSPDHSTSEPPSKRAQMEEDRNDDSEAGSCRRWIQEFHGAAEVLGEGKTLFEEIHESQEAMCKPPMAPFEDNDEWELARWLIKNVTQTATEEFLKMEGVRYCLT